MFKINLTKENLKKYLQKRLPNNGLHSNQPTDKLNFGFKILDKTLLKRMIILLICFKLILKVIPFMILATEMEIQLKILTLEICFLLISKFKV